jgi:hypothetical protein
MAAVLAMTVLQERYQSYKDIKYKNKRMNSSSSIELSAVHTRNAHNNTSIELPEDITSLNVGTPWLVKAKENRYKMLARQGYMPQLRYLAQMARTKKDIRNPAHWFANVCGVKKWERQTLPFLKKAMACAKQAERLAQKLGVSVSKFIYKQIWKGVNVERWAVRAQELGKNKQKYFAWLCTHEKDLMGHVQASP